MNSVLRAILLIGTSPLLHTFQGIVGGVQLKGAVGDEQQAPLRLIGKGTPIDICAMVRCV